MLTLKMFQRVSSLFYQSLISLPQKETKLNAGESVNFRGKSGKGVVVVVFVVFRTQRKGRISPPILSAIQESGCSVPPQDFFTVYLSVCGCQFCWLKKQIKTAVIMEMPTAKLTWSLCPSVECVEKNGYDVCFYHKNFRPVKSTFRKLCCPVITPTIWNTKSWATEQFLCIDEWLSLAQDNPTWLPFTLKTSALLLGTWILSTLPCYQVEPETSACSLSPSVEN